MTPGTVMHAVLLIHAAATAVMLGVILIVQVVHYPLFEHVGAAGWAAYHRAHVRRITWVVFPAMVLELATAAALVLWRPPALAAWSVWLGLGLVGLLWASTGLVQVPLHEALRHGFAADAHRRLVATNWLRTAAWAVRTVLAFGFLARYLR